MCLLGVEEETGVLRDGFVGRFFVWAVFMQCRALRLCIWGSEQAKFRRHSLLSSMAYSTEQTKGKIIPPLALECNLRPIPPKKTAELNRILIQTRSP